MRFDEASPDRSKGTTATAFIGTPVYCVNSQKKTCHAANMSSFISCSQSIIPCVRPTGHRSYIAMGSPPPAGPSDSSDASEQRDNPGDLRDGLERLFEQSPSEWPEDNYEEKVLSDIKSAGVKDMEKLAGDLKNELTNLDNTTEEYAQDLVDDEISKVLVRYEEKQEEILKKQKLQVEEIRKEAQLIQELANSMQNSSSGEAKRGSRQQILLLVASTLGIAAVYYFWMGITENSSPYLQNAAVDGVFAAILAYLSSSKAKTR